MVVVVIVVDLGIASCIRPVTRFFFLVHVGRCCLMRHALLLVVFFFFSPFYVLSGIGVTADVFLSVCMCVCVEAVPQAFSHSCSFFPLVFIGTRGLGSECHTAVNKQKTHLLMPRSEKRKFSVVFSECGGSHW
jgi:hypothetical protein